MGKIYEEPIQEEVASIQEDIIEEGEQFDSSVLVNGRQTVAPSTELSVIYTKEIDNFDLFVKGKYAANNIAERQEAMISFIKLFENILKSNYETFKITIHHFIGKINESFDIYNTGELFAPIYTMKKIPYGVKTERFINLIVFFIGLAENVNSAKRFLSGKDIPYFLKDWTPEQRENIIDFVYSIGS